VGDAVHPELSGPTAAGANLPTATRRTDGGSRLRLAWSDCALRERVEGLALARPEVPFAFESADVLSVAASTLRPRGRRIGALVVDFKTNRLDERVAQDVMEPLLRGAGDDYALAALRTARRRSRWPTHS
jgi:hypothetical protein